jgi:hypothetical protein
MPQPGSATVGAMCMTCVAQGGPYLVGSVVALRTMAASARRRRLAQPGASARYEARPAGRGQQEASATDASTRFAATAAAAVPTRSSVSR